MHLPLLLSLLSVLARKTAAQGFGGVEVTPIFDAPPLEDANLGISVFLVIATFIQLAIAISFIFRVHSKHIAPGIAAIVALLLMFINYVLLVAVIVTSFVTDGFGNLVISNAEELNLGIANSFFADWTEPAIFLTIAFMIRDRYLAYDGTGLKDENRSVLPLSPFMLISYFLALLTVVLSAASVGLAQTLNSASNLSFTELNAEFQASNHLLYAFIAFYLVETILLIPMAVVARKKASSDTIINATLFAVIPLLLIRAISRMILVIIAAPSVTVLNFNPAAFDLADTFVKGGLYFIVVSILCYFFLSIQLWNGPGETEFQLHSGRYSGYQPRPQSMVQLPYPGVPPQQQQQQEGYVPSNVSYQTYPLPQQGAGRYYPNQQPSMQQQQQSPVSPGSGLVGGSPALETSCETAAQAPVIGEA